MSIGTSKSENNPLQVFSGTAWEVALVQSLLENAEIRACIYYGGYGTMAPWDSKGCFPLNRIMVLSDDYEKAKEVVSQYYESLKKQEPPDITENEGLAEDLMN